MGYVAVKPRSRSDIRKITMDIRKNLNLSKTFYLPVDAILEVLACPFRGDEPLLNMEILPDEKMPSEYALYAPEKKLIRIRESVYEGACNRSPRDRFTIAHELGHFFLHPQGCPLSRMNSPVPAYRDPEWQANTFASEFLMPHDLIHGMSVEEVMRRCGTSKKAASIALTK